MANLTVAWQYLTGYAVATDPSDRERSEWPPHPGRVFMALAAAWFETGQSEVESRALRWLESVGDPELVLPPNENVFKRSPTTAYVPVNDQAGPSSAVLQSAPSFTRSKQPRTFPRTYVGDSICAMQWRNIEISDGDLDALRQLADKVTRIGHSSSLVHMWVTLNTMETTNDMIRLVRNETVADVHVRKFSSGLLDNLEQSFGEHDRLRDNELGLQIEDLNAQRKSIKGKGASKRKLEVDEVITNLEQEREKLNPRPPLRPRLGLWAGYKEDRVLENPLVDTTCFDTDVLILTKVEGPDLPLSATYQLMSAVRGMFMHHLGENNVPEWVSGHRQDGSPSNQSDGHLAFFPLPFAGTRHADGHLLGIALAFPRSVDRAVRGHALGAMLIDQNGRPKDLKLTLGRLGVWYLRKSDWSEGRAALKPESWTGHPLGYMTWASVTPVVLDRYPKKDRKKNREAWTEEVVEIVVESCKKIGLPEPNAVDVDTNSWHNGAPRAFIKNRRMRSRSNSASAIATLGEGYPLYPAKGTNGLRPQVHVWLHFTEPVTGPVLLGAGRFMGYGLCKPLRAE